MTTTNTNNNRRLYLVPDASHDAPEEPVVPNDGLRTKGTWWDLREVTHTALGEEPDVRLDVVRIKNGRAVSLCDLSLLGRYGIRLRLDDGTVRPDWPQYVYYFSTRIYIPDRNVRVLARIPEPATMRRYNFEPRPLAGNERPFRYNACHHCGQRALVFNPDIEVVGFEISCRVCRSWRAGEDSYPNVIRARDAYHMELWKKQHGGAQKRAGTP